MSWWCKILREVFLAPRLTVFFFFSGEYDKRWWDSDPLQQPQSAGVSVCQHLRHHGPRRDQAADRDAAGHPEPAGSRQPQQPAQAGRAVPTAMWAHAYTLTVTMSGGLWCVISDIVVVWEVLAKLVEKDGSCRDKSDRFATSGSKFRPLSAKIHLHKHL